MTPDLKQKETQTIEDAFVELDGIVEQLERADVSLEESFLIYQTGMKLLKECSEKIDTVEKRMLMMNEDGGLSEF